MATSSIQELRLRLSDLENHRDKTLLYSPQNISEETTQKRDLKILSDEITLIKKIIDSGGLHRVN